MLFTHIRSIRTLHLEAVVILSGPLLMLRRPIPLLLDLKMEQSRSTKTLQNSKHSKLMLQTMVYLEEDYLESEAKTLLLSTIGKLSTL